MNEHKCGQDMALDSLSDKHLMWHCKICDTYIRVIVEGEKLLFQFLKEPTNYKEQGMSTN